MSCLVRYHDAWVWLSSNFCGFLFALELCSQFVFFLRQPGPNGMLDDWEENLAIITANRTNGDDLVITHLGDCLWKEKVEVCMLCIQRYSFPGLCDQEPYT
jgi:hypothetical protein